MRVTEEELKELGVIKEEPVINQDCYWYDNIQDGNATIATCNYNQWDDNHPDCRGCIYRIPRRIADQLVETFYKMPMGKK